MYNKIKHLFFSSYHKKLCSLSDFTLFCNWFSRLPLPLPPRGHPRLTCRQQPVFPPRLPLSPRPLRPRATTRGRRGMSVSWWSPHPKYQLRRENPTPWWKVSLVVVCSFGLVGSTVYYGVPRVVCMQYSFYCSCQYF